jgi:alkylation response protein AidB-like acyl-CoA dehydrogenase
MSQTVTTTPANSSAAGRFLTSSLRPEDIFTREELNDEQRLFGQTAAEFIRNEVLPHEQRLYQHDWAFVRELLKKAGELDLLRLEIPPAYGGMGLDKISAAYVGEQIALTPSFGGSLGAHTSIGTLPLVYFGTDEQRARYLPRLGSGEMVAAYALTEPQSGSDALAAKTTAVLTPDGKHYILNGQKAWITNGGFADLFTIFAKVDGKLFTAFLVERSMGIVSGADEKKLGLDGSSTTVLMLENVKVPVENVLGKIGEGHKVAFNVLNFGRVKLGTRNMAAAKQALGNAARYAKERRQFGRAIAEFGMIRHKLGEMAVRCYVGDSMSYRTLGDVDRALESVDPDDNARVLTTIESYALECSVNKVWTSEALAYVVDESLQVFGGNGYSREFPAERMYRDARITRIYEGTNEINRLIIPTRLLKQSASLFTAEGMKAALRDDAPAQAGTFAAEYGLLATGKRLAIAALGQVVAVCGDGLKEEQELQAHAADVIIEVYALESALARTEKMVGLRGAGSCSVAIDIAKVYASDAADRMARSGKQLVAALAARGGEVPFTPLVHKLATYTGTDTISARRRISDAVLDAGKYPF